MAAEATKLKDTCSLQGNYDKPRKQIKKEMSLCQQMCIIKAMVFPVIMYGCESWVIKKAEHQRTDAFEPWC